MNSGKRRAESGKRKAESVGRNACALTGDR